MKQKAEFFFQFHLIQRKASLLIFFAFFRFQVSEEKAARVLLPLVSFVSTLSCSWLRLRL